MMIAASPAKTTFSLRLSFLRGGRRQHRSRRQLQHVRYLPRVQQQHRRLRPFPCQRSASPQRQRLGERRQRRTKQQNTHAVSFWLPPIVIPRTWDDAIPTIKSATGAIVWQKQHRRPGQPAPHEACVTAALNRIDGSGSLARAVERNTEWVPCRSAAMANGRCRLHAVPLPAHPGGRPTACGGMGCDRLR